MLREGDALDEAATRATFLIISPASIYAASGHKCARCWNYMPEVSSYGIWQNVCTRCQSALREMNIEPPEAEAVA